VNRPKNELIEKDIRQKARPRRAFLLCSRIVSLLNSGLRAIFLCARNFTRRSLSHRQCYARTCSALALLLRELDGTAPSAW
jgi:hypothetical protein